MRDYTFRLRVTKQRTLTAEYLDPKGERLYPTTDCDDVPGADLVDEVEQLLDAFNQRPGSPTDLDRLGNRLFEILFCRGDKWILSRFTDLLGTVRDDRNGAASLRFELQLGPDMPELVALPWELMKTPDSSDMPDDWIGAAADLSFVRFCEPRRRLDPIQVVGDEQLRIMVVVSAPDPWKEKGNKCYGQVMYKETVEAIKGLNTKGGRSVGVQVLDSTKGEVPDIGAIASSLREFGPHIFHFIGHSRLRDSSGREIGQMALPGPMGSVNWVDANHFGTIFQAHQPFLVLLESCEGGACSKVNAFNGLVPNILERKVPVVIGMQFKVQNQTCLEFARIFYELLVKESAPVDQAVQMARHKLYAERDRPTSVFATPVIFSQVHDTRLFVPPDPVGQAAVDAKKTVDPLSKNKEVHLHLQEMKPVFERIKATVAQERQIAPSARDFPTAEFLLQCRQLREMTIPFKETYGDPCPDDLEIREWEKVLNAPNIAELDRLVTNLNNTFASLPLLIAVAVDAQVKALDLLKLDDLLKTLRSSHQDSVDLDRLEDMARQVRDLKRMNALHLGLQHAQTHLDRVSVEPAKPLNAIGSQVPKIAEGLEKYGGEQYPEIGTLRKSLDALTMKLRQDPSASDEDEGDAEGYGHQVEVDFGSLRFEFEHAFLELDRAMLFRCGEILKLVEDLLRERQRTQNGR